MTFQHRAGVSPYTSRCRFAWTCVFGKQSHGPFLCSPEGPYLSRSYVCILPSSLTRILPSACAFSARPPVSVCGTVPRRRTLGTISRHDDSAHFLPPWGASLAARLRSRICLGPSSARRFGRDYHRPAALRPMRRPVESPGGAGMLTRFPSATALALALGAD